MTRTDPLSLATRDGLPEALRVLLAEYPRDGWQDDPGFDALIRFWLDRHLMFRRVLADLTTATQDMIDRKADPARYVVQLSRLGGLFVNGLHEHHTIEDSYYFPKLVDKDSRLTRGFAILDADHHALDHHLNGFVTGANAALAARDTPERLRPAAGDLLGGLDDLSCLLDRHLIDEEELIVPILLRHGSPAP